MLIASYSGKSHALNASNFVSLDSSSDLQTQFHVTPEISFVLIVMLDLQTQFYVKPEFSFLLTVMAGIQTQFHITYSTLIFIPLDCNGKYPNSGQHNIQHVKFNSS